MRADGRIEKLDSVIASFLASALGIVLDLKEAIAFDARIIPVCGEEAVLECHVQRQAEAWRNHINAYGYYGLQDLGLSEKEAEKRQHGKDGAFWLLRNGTKKKDMIQKRTGTLKSHAIG